MPDRRGTRRGTGRDPRRHDARRHRRNRGPCAVVRAEVRRTPGYGVPRACRYRRRGQGHGRPPCGTRGRAVELSGLFLWHPHRRDVRRAVPDQGPGHGQRRSSGSVGRPGRGCRRAARRFPVGVRCVLCRLRPVLRVCARSGPVEGHVTVPAVDPAADRRAGPDDARPSTHLRRRDDRGESGVVFGHALGTAARGVGAADRGQREYVAAAGGPVRGPRLLGRLHEHLGHLHGGALCGRPATDRSGPDRSSRCRIPQGGAVCRRRSRNRPGRP